MSRKISIAKDFSRYPAGRNQDDGPYSGELFRKKFLEPAMAEDIPLIIGLDGARGYGSSFLEEAFGGLVRSGYSAEKIRSLVSFESTDASLISEIIEYIENINV